MKKLLYTFLAAMCCTVMALAANSKATKIEYEPGKIMYFILNENHTATVTWGGNDSFSGTTEYAGSITIPSTVRYDEKDYTVTGIGDNAFLFCNTMSSVTIPEGVTSIGAMAFRACQGLNSITIPEGVTSIGEMAFMACTGLNSITILEGVTSIGASAFENTGWYNEQKDGLVYLYNYLLGLKGVNKPTNIVIKDGTMTIADHALSNCWSLVSITIPASVNSIGAEAFMDCESLASITVAEENTIYESPDNCNAIIEKSTHTLLWGCKNTVIPNTVTNIYRFAFRKHTGLTSITIPESVTSIGEGAFQSTGLTSVIIGKSVETIGDNAFKNCQNMTEIDVLATTPPNLGTDAFDIVPKDIPVYVPDVDAYKKTSWGEFTNLIKYVDLPTAKEEAIADLQTFINKEKIANPPKEKYESSINAATAKKDIPSIVNDIKAEINNYTKFTLGEWKYLLDKNDEKYTIVGGSLTFTDKELYQSGNDFTVTGNLEYSRTFAATGVWQAWFVPFNVTVGKMDQAGMEVAKIAGVLMDGEVPYIAFAKMTDQYAIVNANTPYVVKATESSVNMTLTGPDMCIRKSTDAEQKAQRLTVQSSFDTFTFGGNYQQTNGYANEWYALNTSGTFQKMGDGANLAPQRFWMTIDTRTDTPYHTGSSATAKAFIGMTVLGDDEPTGIESLTPTLSEGNGVIYNLQGQKVTSIQKGQVYIMNGKKFFAR